MSTTISVYNPASGQVIGINPVPFLVFSSGVQSASLVFNIKDSGNNIIPSIPSYNSGIFTYALVLLQNLNYSSAYNGVFSSGMDLTGAQIIPFSWPFFTSDASRNMGPMEWGAM